MTPPPSLRVASLLPSATEICCALGLEGHLVGRSHECDFPPDIERLPVLTRATVDSRATSAEIDRQVRRQLTEGLSLYEVEETTLRELAPDLVITQDTCDLCAVSFSTVQESVARLLGAETPIVSLSPTSVDDVLEDHLRVARAAGRAAEGERVAEGLRGDFDALRCRTGNLDRPTALLLEWIDPPMPAGHWSPELLELAGVEAVLGHRHQPTRATTWEAVAEADPDVILLAPCGFPLEQTRRELPTFFDLPIVAGLRAVREGRTYAIDGNAFFNRPGPRLVESARIAARILHPEATADLEVPGGAWIPVGEEGRNAG
ncbi:MAG: ABC transporter substrate-binding protein [Holophagales bacterium]|nr:ABC transporter substrate-binding protein [Holophagales bacterium]